MSLALISVAELKAALHDGEELALLDAREEVPFDKRHLLMASCLPLGRIELLASELLPRRTLGLSGVMTVKAWPSAPRPAVGVGVLQR